jgi:molybdopterin adenylyltransferase
MQMDTRVNVILFSHPLPLFGRAVFSPIKGRPYNRRMTVAAVITVSDSSFRGQRADLSGPAVAAELTAQGFDVDLRLLVADDQRAIEDALRDAAKKAPLVVTTGGTGISDRDVTPEATRAVCSRLLDGIPELMRAEGRQETPYAVLSRALCGTFRTGSGQNTLVLNLPGSPRGAVTSLRIALPLLKHALDLLAGNLEHAESAAGGGN